MIPKRRNFGAGPVFLYPNAMSRVEERYTPEGQQGTKSRKKTSIQREDIKDIAYLYHIEKKLVSDIAKIYKTKKGRVVDIVNGSNFNQEWSSAVIDLIVAGNECNRSHRLDILNDKSPSPNRKLTRSQVLGIRREWKKGGASKAEVARRLGLSANSVVSVLSGKSYKDVQLEDINDTA